MEEAIHRIKSNAPDVLLSDGGSVNTTLLDATREAGEPRHLAYPSTVFKTIWFQWTAPESKPTSFEITSAEGSFDPTMTVYTGNSYSTLDPVAFNNDTVSSRPRVEFAAVAGTTYRIVIGNYNNINSFGNEFTLAWTQSDKPLNDNFSSALNLNTSTDGGVAVTNRNATREAGEPTHIGATDHSVWFNYKNPTVRDFSVTFRTTASVPSLLNTTISVYTGAQGNDLTPVVKNDNLGNSPKSSVTFLAKAGVTYRIAVDSTNIYSGDIILDWNISRVGYNTDFGSKNAATTEVFDDDATD